MFKYGRSLYESNDVYSVHHYKNHAEWLSGRTVMHGVGGSDAAAAIGRSPWRTNVELWRIKTGRSTAPDISDSRRVQDGVNEEEPIRRLFQVETQDRYEVQYLDNTILQNIKHQEMLYSPDGLLIDKKTGKHGILEIKTTEIMKSFDREKWGTKEAPAIPDNYYVQILHGMNVTGFEFAVLYARLKYPDGSLIFRPADTYKTTAEDTAEDRQWIKNGVIEFWKYVSTDREPALILPKI